jgi:hypothetical protein
LVHNKGSWALGDSLQKDYGIKLSILKSNVNVIFFLLNGSGGDNGSYLLHKMMAFVLLESGGGGQQWR